MQLKTILAIRHKKFSSGELGAGETSFAEDKSPWLRNKAEHGVCSWHRGITASDFLILAVFGSSIDRVRSFWQCRCKGHSAVLLTAFLGNGVSVSPEVCYWRRCCERCQPTQQWACAGTGAGRRTSQFNSELVTLMTLPQGCLGCGRTVQKWVNGAWQSLYRWCQKDKGATQQPCRAADLRGFVKSPEFRRSDFAFSFSFDLKISEIFYHSVFRKTSGWVPGLRKHFHNHFRKVFGKKYSRWMKGSASTAASTRWAVAAPGQRGHTPLRFGLFHRAHLDTTMTRLWLKHGELSPRATRHPRGGEVCVW